MSGYGEPKIGGACPTMVENSPLFVSHGCAANVYPPAKRSASGQTAFPPDPKFEPRHGIA
jgi:hypothetical protein